MPNMQGRRYPSERQEQEAIVRWFRLKYPKEIIYAIPNGGSRNPIEARNLKLSGVLAGTPDLHICVGRGDYFGLFVEMKSEKGRLSSVQANVINRLNSAGYLAIVCRGFESAKDAIMNYMEI